MNTSLHFHCRKIQLDVQGNNIYFVFQKDLKTCQTNAAGRMLLSPGNEPSIALPSRSSAPPSRHIRNYFLRTQGAAAGGGTGNEETSVNRNGGHENQGSGRDGASSIVSSVNSNTQHQQPPQQPISGNPNEDLAGNVLI